MKFENVVRYIPLTNGTAYMGMGPNTGLNAGKDYPYVLWADYESLKHELEFERALHRSDADYWQDCLAKVDRKLDAVTIECDKWRYDAQLLALRDQGTAAMAQRLNDLEVLLHERGIIL